MPDSQIFILFASIPANDENDRDRPGMGFQSWTVREVTPKGHGRCGMLRRTKPDEFLNEAACGMDLEPDIRIAGGDEMKENAERIETFAEFQMTPPDVVLVTAATYKVNSHTMGDTSGLRANFDDFPITT
ncbi:MAG: hypothetical protein SFV81_28630 [Pirellulaceae bacterium]|nr:hypothetical protein [Pirellulaceae bacterium]